MTGTLVSALPNAAKIRQELQDLVLRDLLGPAGGEHEIVAEPTVRDRCILGLLAPRGQSALPDEDDAGKPQPGVTASTRRRRDCVDFDSSRGKALIPGPSPRGRRVEEAAHANDVKYGHLIQNRVNIFVRMRRLS